MITGGVNSSLEAVVRLYIEDVNGQSQAFDLKIDTGFTDFICLPASIVTALGLPLDINEQVQLADGTITRVPIHSGVVIWDGRPRRVDIHALGYEGTIGMAMLAGHDLAIRVTDGGTVSIGLIP
jgi:clan AA aspartic protease